MTKQKEKRGGKKLGYVDVLDVITTIVKDIEEEKVGPISNSEIQARLKIEKGIEASDQTIRNYGMRKDSIFDLEFDEIFEFVNFGDTRMRGMIINREKFLENQDRIRAEVES